MFDMLGVCGAKQGHTSKLSYPNQAAFAALATTQSDPKLTSAHLSNCQLLIMLLSMHVVYKCSAGGAFAAAPLTASDSATVHMSDTDPLQLGALACRQTTNWLYRA